MQYKIQKLQWKKKKTVFIIGMDGNIFVSNTGYFSIRIFFIQKGNNVMKLGAQLYSVRNTTQTPEAYLETMKRIKEIGYENVQLSGAAPMDAAYLAQVSRELDLPIVCTHVAFDRIVNDTEALIAEHKTFGSPVIGIGSMPSQFRKTKGGLEAFLKEMEEPVKKIQAAGLNFSYHNHHFEFVKEDEADEKIIFDRFLESCPTWHFILDTYWVEYAGYSALEYIKKVGGKRLFNIHFKDMDRDEKKSICACGRGLLDFTAIAALCKEEGVVNVLVEQDNAPNAPDAFEEMKYSYRHLRPILDAVQ